MVDTRPIDSADEARLLKVGYFAMMAERPPFSQDIGQCKTPESAFLYSLEVGHMRVPDELRFEALKKDIPPKHQPRLARIWAKVLEMQGAWEDAVLALQRKWEDAPNTPDRAAKDVVRENALSIRKDLHRAVSAIVSVSKPPQGSHTRRMSVHHWKIEEEALRTKFYNADKNYLVALRLYYEMLLEKSEKKADETPQESVLPLDHPLRMKIVLENRYLRLIDATHQAMSIAKAAHHEQQTRRLRKVQRVPYVAHPISVEMAYILDVVPFVIEQEKMPHSVVEGTTAAALHDVGEDTQLTLEDILRDFLRTRADKIDSHLDQAIESGFGMSRDLIKRKMLHLVGDEVLSELRIILWALSHNAKSSDAEKKKALQQNAAGKERTRTLLGLDDSAYLHWGLDPETFEPPLKTFVDFPKSYEEDLDHFLVRLHLVNKRAKQQALMMKIEDRADNLKDAKELPPATQAKKLRSTVSRIIAYAMLDYNQENLPLYNALPRLIDVTLREYERFLSECPAETIPEDASLVERLRTWRSEVRRFEVPESVQGVLDSYQTLSKRPRDDGPIESIRKLLRRGIMFLSSM